jgi:TonB family protein
MQQRARLFVTLLIALGTAVPALSQAQATPRPLDVGSAGCRPPVLPRDIAKAGAAGETDIAFTVEPSGKVTHAVVARSSGATPAHKALDQASLASVKSCHFTPVHGYGPAQALQSFNYGVQPANHSAQPPVPDAAAPQAPASQAR